MPQWTATQAARNWIIINLYFHILSTRGVPRLLVRYESYTKHPQRDLERIREFLPPAIGAPSLDRPSDLSLAFVQDHSLGGNPIRFSNDKVDLVCDEEWRVSMPVRDRLYVGTLTLPLLLAYGLVGSRARD